MSEQKNIDMDVEAEIAATSGTGSASVTYIKTQIINSSPEVVKETDFNTESPYKGLKKFVPDDRNNFFGRDTLISKLLEAVDKSNLSLILGDSGSGKSSLVNAGLIPEWSKYIKKRKSLQAYDFILMPLQDPFNSLYSCLTSPINNKNFTHSQAKVALEAEEGTLSKTINNLRNDGENWLIFIDQFEQLFTISDPDKCRKFISGLVQVAGTKSDSVKIVLAMRSDFLPQLIVHRDLFEIANQSNMHPIVTMSSLELKQVIEQPAARHGVYFQRGLVDTIIKEMEGEKKGYLPLLQYTLDLLWESECKVLDDKDNRKIEEKRELTKKTYNELNGVVGALKKHVNQIYENLSQEQQTVTKQIFLKLVDFNKNDSGKMIAVSKPEFSDKFGKGNWVHPTWE